jgi:hypothetical protein
VVLLGLTWSFGLLYLNVNTVAFAYVFTVCNSLQGAFIFIFHVLLNRRVSPRLCVGREYTFVCSFVAKQLISSKHNQQNTQPDNDTVDSLASAN